MDTNKKKEKETEEEIPWWNKLPSQQEGQPQASISGALPKIPHGNVGALQGQTPLTQTTPMPRVTPNMPAGQWALNGMVGAGAFVPDQSGQNVSVGEAGGGQAAVGMQMPTGVQMPVQQAVPQQRQTQGQPTVVMPVQQTGTQSQASPASTTGTQNSVGQSYAAPFGNYAMPGVGKKPTGSPQPVPSMQATKAFNAVPAQGQPTMQAPSGRVAGQNGTSFVQGTDVGATSEPGKKPKKGESFRKKPPILKMVGIMAAIVAIVAVLGVGVTFAMPLIQGSGQNQEQPEPSAPAEETPQEQSSNVYVTVNADGADQESSAAGVSVLKDESGDEVAISSTAANPGGRVLLGMLPAGKYRLHVDSVPTNKDGSTYSSPFFDQTFEIAGDGKDVELTLTLDKAASDTQGDKKSDDSSSDSKDSKDDDSSSTEAQNKDDNKVAEAKAQAEAEKAARKQAEQDAKAAKAEATAAKKAAAKEETSSKSSSTSSKNTTSHTHTWKAVTKTIHHKAVYRKVKHAAVKERVTICDKCGANITGKFSEHKSSTGHSSYHYENKVTKKAYTEKVLVSKAYDETKVTGYKCSTCGKKK